jgi:hypothetical protein
MSALRAVRLLSANALGVFPLAHAVTDVYISNVAKINAAYVWRHHPAALKIFDVANISIYF